MIAYLPALVILAAAVLGLAVLALAGPTMPAASPHYIGRAPVPGRPSITPTAEESR